MFKFHFYKQVAPPGLHSFISMEEALMIQHNYNAYPSQETGHTKFIEDLTDLEKDFKAKSVTTNLLVRIQCQLCDWLTKHIGNEGKIFSTFLKMMGCMG